MLWQNLLIFVCRLRINICYNAPALPHYYICSRQTYSVALCCWQIEGIADEVVFDHLHATAFQFSPLGRTILGSAENVKKLTRGDLVDYMATHYSAPRMVLSGAGAVDHQELVSLATKAFSGLPAGSATVADLIKQVLACFTDAVFLCMALRMMGLHVCLLRCVACFRTPRTQPSSPARWWKLQTQTCPIATWQFPSRVFPGRTQMPWP